MRRSKRRKRDRTPPPTPPPEDVLVPGSPELLPPPPPTPPPPPPQKELPLDEGKWRACLDKLREPYAYISDDAVSVWILACRNQFGEVVGGLHDCLYSPEMENPSFIRPRPATARAGAELVIHDKHYRVMATDYTTTVWYADSIDHRLGKDERALLSDHASTRFSMVDPVIIPVDAQQQSGMRFLLRI